MTRIFARADDGTETDITDDVRAVLDGLVIHPSHLPTVFYDEDFLPEAPYGYDVPQYVEEIQVRARIWHLLGRHDGYRQWLQDRASYLAATKEAAARRDLRAKFEAETAAAREAEFQRWAAQQEPT